MPLTIDCENFLHDGFLILKFSIITMILVISSKNFKPKKDVEDIQKNLAMQQCPKVYNVQYNFSSTFVTT